MNDACGGFKKYRAAAGAGALFLAAAGAGAGTVTVDRVVADTVLAREIGGLPPKPEVIYYPFSVAPGSSVPNAAGADYTGTKSGCGWTSGGRYAGGAMSFDGVNDYIRVTDDPKVPEWDRYSVSVWFLHNGGGSADGTGQKIIDKSYGTTKYWHVSLDAASGAVGWRLNMTNYSPVEMVDGTADYRDGAWHHAAAVRDGTNGWLWIDGALKAGSAGMFPVDNSTDLYVGYSDSSSSAFRKCWSGLIDEVRVYDYALPPAAVMDLYGAGSVIYRDTPVSVTTNLVVRGGLTVTGGVSFTRGVYYSRPLGDLSCGIYTNAP